MKQQYYAHSREGENGTEYQTIEEHAVGVAALVKEFSCEWCDETLAEDIGLLHDVGKYQPAFQERILHGGIKVEHSNCGAKEWATYHLPDGVAYIISGHHAGLPDVGNIVRTGDHPTLIARLQRGDGDYSEYKEELPVKVLPEGTDLFKGSVQGSGEAAWKEYAFWIRMTYSCLTDADFLDTERFCGGETERGLYADLSECAALLDRKLLALEENAATETEKARKNLRSQIMSHADENANIYYMNMPTGSGKTLASMRFALARAIAGKKKRIIYAIPYTSIIEQNAKVFKEIFGEDKVLEHHCNFDYDEAKRDEAKRDEAKRGEAKLGEEKEGTIEKMRRATENWDASIIVTTNVQFFQSIYGNRPGEMRKLHNIADSVLLFDEVHMLPSGCFQPCLEAIKILTTRYGCEAIFMTATMPDFDRWLSEFKCEGLRTRNLIDDSACFSAFKRCRIEDLGMVSDEALLMRADEAKNALVVVNTREKAKRLYELYAGQKYHLSTYMTHADRDETIAKVKAALEKGEHFCLFSTSLIEAGVDLDFDAVFREMAGLENLLQTAGRCNRNGRRDKGECIAYSFKSKDKPPKEVETKIYYTQANFEQFETVDSVEAIQEYFNNLYKDERANMTARDFANASSTDGNAANKAYYAFFKTTGVITTELKRLTKFNFAGYAQSFRMIDDNTRPLIIVDKRNRAEVDGLFAALERGVSGKTIGRKLQKYTVSLRSYDWDKLLKAGVIETNGVFDCLANENYYSSDTGLGFEDRGEYIL